jgi:zeaxanthin glucosyltransferase
MSHFGVLSYKGTGHLNSLIALSRRLVSRGHRVTFFHEQELERRICEAGLEFRPIDGFSGQYPSSNTTDNKFRSKPGLRRLRYRIKRITDEIESYLCHAPKILSQARVDALIIDELVLSGPTLAQLLHLPYFIVSTSVPHNFGWSVPHSLSQCRNPISAADRLESALLQVSVFRLRGPVKWRLEQCRKRLGLGPTAIMQELYPALGHLATLPACLDFPQSSLPANFHYTGPFVDQSARPRVDFPWDKLDGRPLIYVSLGTAKKIRSILFQIIAEACDGLGLQVVISLGGSRNPEILDDLKGNPLIVREAPQLELISRSAIVINHAGINTVLEALMAGKPMVVIPIAHDQPALAARLAWLEVAEVIPEKRLTLRLLRRAIEKILINENYRQQALRLQSAIHAANGLDLAVEIIRSSMESHDHRKTNTPVLQGVAHNRQDCGLPTTGFHRITEASKRG